MHKSKYVQENEVHKIHWDFDIQARRKAITSSCFHLVNFAAPMEH